jgi:hypothetical protein
MNMRDYENHSSLIIIYWLINGWEKIFQRTEEEIIKYYR